MNKIMAANKLKLMRFIIVLAVLAIITTGCGPLSGNDEPVANADTTASDKAIFTDMETADSQLYTNTAYGFTLTFPESWRGRYIITEHGDTILVRHKLTVEQIGSQDDGYIGTLFRIYVYSPKSKWENDGVPFSPATGRHTIGESASAWYALEYPTDVQWFDAAHAEDYVELKNDTNWIENGGFDVIGGNLLDLSKAGRFLTEDEIALTLDEKEVKYSDQLMYRYDGNDIYFNAQELGQILGIKVVEAFEKEAGDGLEIAPGRSVATFHEGLICFQYQDDAYVYTAISNSDSWLEPEQVRKALVIDSQYYISASTIPFLFYSRIDIRDYGYGKAQGQVSFTTFKTEAARAKRVADLSGFIFELDGRLRFDKYILLGAYVVYKDHQAYVMNRDGRAFIGPINGALSYTPYGYMVTVPDGRGGELRGLYAHSGEKILEPEYSAIDSVDFRKGLFLLAKGSGADRKLGAAVIDYTRLTALIPVEFEEVMTWSGQAQIGPPEYELYFDKYVSVKKDGRWGAYDLAGRLVVPLEYEAFGQLLKTGDTGYYTDYYNLYFDRDRELITVRKGGKWGVISMQNEVIVPFAYDKIFTKDPAALNNTWYGQKAGVETKLN